MSRTYEFTEEERELLSAFLNSEIKYIDERMTVYSDSDNVGLMDFEIQRKLRIKRKTLETLSTKLNQAEKLQ